jgi:hypothetical protein
MRSILNLGVAAFAALVAGCQVVGYAGNPDFDDPFVNDTIGARPYNFPYVLYFPDDTMYFFPTYTGAPSSDLIVLAMRCDPQDDGSLKVTARLENEGSWPVVPDWFSSGELSALRVAAFVTTADGAHETVEATRMQPLPVAATVDMTMGPTRARAADIVRVDVVADPTHVVPDPLRDNNVLSWDGGAHPDLLACTRAR